MHQSIGQLIRQARLQHHLTQSELGGNRYSKSYVSLVEHDKIQASPHALSFFAEQLGHSSDYFTSVLQQLESMRQLSVLDASDLRISDSSEHLLHSDEASVLDIVLESTELYNFSARHELPTLSLEVIRTLPPYKQASYYFMMGLVAQEKGDLSTALQSFEAAIGFASTRLQVAILDELGVNHYLAQSYKAALRYHQRALNLLQKESPGEATAALQFKIHFHCGNDYRALGVYEQACQQYELARMSLHPEHDIKTAASLYQGLGYCTHAAIYQKSAPNMAADVQAMAEEMEREFQRSVDFFVQSSILYQVSGDKIGEATVRLEIALAKLNLSIRRRQFAQEKARNIGRETFINCASLLKEAEEQCRQVLMSWHYPLGETGTPVEIDTIIYVALAYLIRIALQRAMLARLSGYADAALRERGLATNICQQVLDTLSERVLPWTLIHNTLSLQVDGLDYQQAFLPRLPNVSSPYDTLHHSPVSQIEVYFAAGEVAEELGRVATTHDYTTDCYIRANQCFQAALSLARAYSAEPGSKAEPAYLGRCYQRCISIVEERSIDSPVETTRALFDILIALPATHTIFLLDPIGISQ